MHSYSVRTRLHIWRPNLLFFWGFLCTAAPVQSDWTDSIWELESLATDSQLVSRCSQTVLTHQSTVVLSGPCVGSLSSRKLKLRSSFRSAASRTDLVSGFSSSYFSIIHIYVYFPYSKKTHTKKNVSLGVW